MSKGVGLTAMKTQAGRSKPGEDMPELKLLDQFTSKGLSPKQAALKAVWENPEIASICSQMPNLTILASNYQAATDQARLSDAQRRSLEEYAQASCSSYCAGCANICQAAAGGAPIAEIMRYLMYHNDYGLADHAREMFAQLPDAFRSRLAELDYSRAQRLCPQRIEIARMMMLAGETLA